MRLPKIFIASSNENKDSIAHAMQFLLNDSADCIVWNQNFFAPSSYALIDICEKAKLFDYAIFVFSTDDKAIIKGESVSCVRDNVLFELGIFIGNIGRERCFVISPIGADIHIPTDITGLTLLKYRLHQDSDYTASLGSAAHEIKLAIKKNSLRYAAGNELIESVRQSGITDILFGRNGLQSHGYGSDSIVNSLRKNDKIYVFARSAKSFGSQWKLIRKKIQSDNVHFSFILGNPELTTHDLFGKTDIPIVIELLNKVGIPNKCEIFLLPMFVTTSFIYVESNDSDWAVVDFFVDLPFEKRHCIVAKRDKESPSLLVDAVSALAEMYIDLSTPYMPDKTNGDAK